MGIGRPEPRRLRLGGELRYLGNSVLLMLCLPEQEGVPAEATLLRDQAGVHRYTWPDDPSVESHASHGDTIALLRDCGFEVLRLAELRPRSDTSTRYDFVTLDWARRWPSEEVWFARR